MRVLLTCAGTAGHINPAIAVADRLKRLMPETEFLFVGSGKMCIRDRYKAAFNMTQVADYAQNVLGMVPATTESTEYLEVQKEDMAVILESDAPAAENEGSVIGFLTSLMSYFR